ncbi:ABC transporter substrate-binding protein [Myxococcota bacterium]
MWIGNLTKLTQQVGWLAVVLGAASCGSNESNRSTPAGVTATSQERTVDILSHWFFPGGIEGLQDLIKIHKDNHPEDQVINDARIGMGWDAVLAERIAAGNIPNVYVQPSSEVAGFLQKYGADSLQPLDDFLALPSQAAVLPNLPPELVADVTVNDQIYGLPAGNVLRANGVFYNRHVFAANQLNPPTTLDEFLTVCRKFKAAGVNCVTTTYMGLLFEGLLAGLMGIDAYYSYRSGGEPDETALRQGIDLFAEVVDNYLDPTAMGPIGGGDLAMNALVSGQAAMWTMGDWMKASLEEMGWTPGVDYGVIASPGNAGLFVYAADVFTSPTGASDLPGALSFLGTVASVEGQIAFIGFDATPARRDVQVTTDSERGGIIADWKQAKYHLAGNSHLTWEGPLQWFARATQRDKEGLLQHLLTVP